MLQQMLRDTMIRLRQEARCLTFDSTCVMQLQGDSPPLQICMLDLINRERLLVAVFAHKTSGFNKLNYVHFDLCLKL